MWKLLNDDPIDIRFTDAGIMKLAQGRRGIIILKYHNESELAGLKNYCTLVSPYNLHEMEMHSSFFRKSPFSQMLLFRAPSLHDDPVIRGFTYFTFKRYSPLRVYLIADPFDDTDGIFLGPYCSRFLYLPSNVQTHKNTNTLSADPDGFGGQCIRYYFSNFSSFFKIKQEPSLV